MRHLSTFPNFFKKGLGLQIETDEKNIFTIKTYSGNKKKSTKLAEQAMKQITEYKDGKRKKFDLPLKFEGTDFQVKVWKNLAKIPFAKTVSYQDLANKAGSPKGFRAVGSACGKNPLLIVVPCHRVLPKSGGLGGFAGGLWLKEELLTIEDHPLT